VESSSPSKASTAAPAVSVSNTLNRFKTTVEVSVSKIFPAGFGWQTFSVLAGDMGYTATDAGFALMTGLGDFTGVFLGHSTYYVLKSAIEKEKKTDVGQEIQTAFFLGSAAFCSGKIAWPFCLCVIFNLIRFLKPFRR